MLTYIGKETTYVTKIFKRANLQIAYHTNNPIQANLIPTPRISEKISASGVYKLTCPECGKTSIGQRGKTFP